MALITQIDFSDPQDPAAPRLRCALGPPREVLVACLPGELRAVLDAVEAAAAQGAWCVGGVRYEAAGAFDAALQTHPADGPLAWFAVHDAPGPWPGDPPPAAAAPTLQWDPVLDRARFDADLAAIHAAIARGDYYQVNYTAPLRATVQGGGAEAAPALFAALQCAQPGGYAACIDMGDVQVLSVSPELFFDWQSGAEDDEGHILTRPMKGTAPRGATPEHDAALAQGLRASPKERAENVMIVDLLRNDLSRIATPHSVQVPRLFHTEALPAVWQMTSDVQARTRAGTRLVDVFAALFPCGSVTGAPKVRAMQAIAQLEQGPRGFYCGAVGVVRPGERGGIHATFNVPIRTVVLQGDQACCGIGSGITADAMADAEWAEWQHKRAFVERASAPFDVLETLALDGGQFRHLDEHLTRMQQAATHFGFSWDGAAVRQCLQALASRHPQGAWRTRLLLDAAGTPRAEAFALAATPEPVRLQLAGGPLMEAHGEFVRFKTTRRAHYAAFAPQEPGVFDTVLWNAEGEITESTFGNIAMLLDGHWVTPPLACGLLPGVGRAVALRDGRVCEAVVRLQDLPRVQGWAFINSLRGWLQARLG